MDAQKTPNDESLRLELQEALVTFRHWTTQANQASGVIITRLSGTARLNKWTQLTGVFDATHQIFTLYVDGQQAGQVTGVQNWSAPASGPLRLGDVLPGGSASSWNGQVSNVCVFYGPLQGADVQLLRTGDSAHPHNGCAALYAKYP